jgi:hypothetical protein
LGVNNRHFKKNELSGEQGRKIQNNLSNGEKNVPTTIITFEITSARYRQESTQNDKIQ